MELKTRISYAEKIWTGVFLHRNSKLNFFEIYLVIFVHERPARKLLPSQTFFSKTILGGLIFTIEATSTEIIKNWVRTYDQFR